MISISEKYLKALKDNRKKIRNDTHSLGVAAYEYNKACKFFNTKIESHIRTHQDLGEQALADIDIDSESGDYTIDEDTGEVKKLVNGEYVEL